MSLALQDARCRPGLQTRLFAGLVVALLVGLSTATVVSQNSACTDLSRLVLHDASFKSASDIAAGPFAVPGSRPGAPGLKLPAFCRVIGVATPSSDSAIGFEIWMPPRAAWNGRFQTVGTTGFLGAIEYGDMAAALSRGYAVAGSDAGHAGGELKFADGHPEKIIDWSYRAMHVVTDVAKLVVRNYEGRHPDFSYFFGCNTGGHQALSEAQRYPDDFDGIVAGAPANDRINEIVAYQHVWRASHDNSGKNILPADKLHLLGQAVVKACDRLDGVQDGVLENPLQCRFDPESLKCDGASTASCLTAAELTAVRKIYEGPHNPRTGERIFPGWPFGSESAGPTATQGQGWRQIVDLPEPRRTEFWNYFVFNNPSWDWRTFDFDRDLEYANRKVGYVSAIDHDLTAFKRSGGKLLLYAGWSDPILPGGDPIHYYEEVTHAMGGRDATESFARLFMMPGVGHCSGGPGPDTIDPVTAVEAWVEKGVAPEKLIATKLEAGKAVRERPLCAYPRVAKYSGTGSTDIAASFSCQM